MNQQMKENRSLSDVDRLSLGTAFLALRNEAGITQEELAAANEGDTCCVRTISAVETGEPFTMQMLRRMLDALNELRVRRGVGSVHLSQAGDEWKICKTAESWLELPRRIWQSRLHGPGALLTADFRVVPFHGEKSLEELTRLVAWCNAAPRLGIWIYKGEGGMGKTRLALELCHSLSKLSDKKWTVGFAQESHFPEAGNPWETLRGLERPLLVVVDYAGDGSKIRMISQLLRHFTACAAPKLRLLFLERDEHWLDRLHEDRAAREILLGPLLSRSGAEDVHSLMPVATEPHERLQSYHTAMNAYGKLLHLKSPGDPNDLLQASLFQSVLFIHMQALLALLGDSATSKQAILRHLLARERDYWKKRIEDLGLSHGLLPAVEQAVCELCKSNGASDVAKGMKALRRSPLLKDQSELVLTQILQLLRECYPVDTHGIAPLQPDMLKHFVMARSVRSR